MKRLTPATVTMMMVVVVGLLVTAYFAKMLRAEEPQETPIEASARPPAPPKPKIESREIPIALGALEPGTEITAAHIGAAHVPADKLPPETILQERGVIGRVVKEPIAALAPIRSSQLYLPGERAPLAVAPGMRAVSVSTSQGASIDSRLLRPDQYVDVYFTSQPVDSTDGRVRERSNLTLLNGVRVLAIANAGADSSVTLELTPEQASNLILARNKGDIALSYNPEGKGNGGVVVKNLDRSTPNEIVSPEAGSRPFISESYKGSTRSTLQFSESPSSVE